MDRYGCESKNTTSFFLTEKEVLMATSLLETSSRYINIPNEFKYPVTQEPSEKFWNKVKTYFHLKFSK